MKLDESAVEIKNVVASVNEIVESAVSSAVLEAAKAVCKKVEEVLGVEEDVEEPVVEEPVVEEPSEPEAE